MKKTIAITKLINLFCVVCVGCYFALMVEFGIDFTLGAGFVISLLVAICTRIGVEKIKKNFEEKG